MAGHPGTRSHTGAPPRSLAIADLIARREELLTHPVSQERSRALSRIRCQIQSINARSERRGA